MTTGKQTWKWELSSSINIAIFNTDSGRYIASIVSTAQRDTSNNTAVRTSISCSMTRAIDQRSSLSMHSTRNRVDRLPTSQPSRRPLMRLNHRYSRWTRGLPMYLSVQYRPKTVRKLYEYTNMYGGGGGGETVCICTAASAAYH